MSTRQWRWPVCLLSLGLEVAKLTVTEVLGNYEPRGIDTQLDILELIKFLQVSSVCTNLSSF